MFRTIDGGVTWLRSDEGLTGNDVRTLETGAGRIYAGTPHSDLGYGAGDATLQRSAVVSGFSGSPQNQQITAIGAHPTDPTIAVVGLSGAGLKFWGNGGTLWVNGSASLSTAQIDAITFDPRNPQLAYVAARAGSPTPIAPIHRSTDGGINFNPVGGAGLANVWVKRLAVDPANSSRLFIASQLFGGSNGVFRSEDSGETWTRLIDAATFDLAIDPADSRRVYALAEGVPLISDNGGDSFAPVTALPQPTYGNPFAMTLDPTLSSVVYILSAKHTPPSHTEYFIMRSVDRGVSWERVPNNTQPVWAPTKLAVNAATPTVLFVATAVRGVQSFEIAPDLAVEILNHSATRPLDVQSSFDVRVQNIGPLAATNVQIDVNLGARAQDASATIPGGTCTTTPTGVRCSRRRS